MTQQDTDLAYEILDMVLESFEVKPEKVLFQTEIDNTPRPPGLSLSSSGKSERYLAHMLSGTDKKDSQPRYMAGMDMGSLAHDYIRWCLEQHPDVEMSDAEREVELLVGPFNVAEGDPGHGVRGHIDGFIKFGDKRILLDIKCVNLYTFNDLDPRNPHDNWFKRTRTWAAGNYVFDAVEAFAHDMFKKDYIAQVACYEAALADEGEKWDATAFILYCRDTSHIGVGIFNPGEDEWEEIVGQARKRMAKVLDNPDPFEYDTCWDAAEGAEPHKVCQYCPYVEECFKLKTRVYRGKPRMQILEIR